MSFEEFLAAATPPPDASPALQALWHAANRQDPAAWDRAHERAQADVSREGSWVHAHLHRVEGDESNAAYWYARAGKKPPSKSMGLDAEREAMIRELLGPR